MPAAKNLPISFAAAAAVFAAAANERTPALPTAPCARPAAALPPAAQRPQLLCWIRAVPALSGIHTLSQLCIIRHLPSTTPPGSAQQPAPPQHAARPPPTPTCAVGAATRHAGDTGHSASRAPRLGSGLMAGLGAHCVGLALVLVQVGVHRLHNVRPDGGQQNLQGGAGVMRCSWRLAAWRHTP